MLGAGRESTEEVGNLVVKTRNCRQFGNKLDSMLEKASLWTLLLPHTHFLGPSLVEGISINQLLLCIFLNH
jgi:hypothetical protein